MSRKWSLFRIYSTEYWANRRKRSMEEHYGKKVKIVKTKRGYEVWINDPVLGLFTEFSGSPGRKK